jgi:hypothetical protein
MDIGNAVGAPFNGYVLRGGSGGVIFVRVNQVLVRLWARRGRKSDRMWSVLNGMGPPAIVAMCSEACVVHITGARPVMLSKMILVRDCSWVQALVFGLGCL